MCFTSLFSQEKIVNEANAANQQNQSEAIILYQQQFLDSVLKERLRNDLLHANGNDMKTIELEKMIAKIETEDSLRKVELLKKIDYLKKNVKGAGVVPFQDTLFYLHARAASYDPEERAANIKKRILKLYADPFFDPDSIVLIQTENGTEISYKDQAVVMIVTKLDAMYFDKEDHQLASEYKNRIRNSIVKELEDNSLKNIIQRIVMVLLIITGLSLFIYLINLVFDSVKLFLTKSGKRFLDGFTIKNVNLLSSRHLAILILKIIGVIRIVVIILAFYLSLPLLFSLFPETKMWTNKLLEWILTPAINAFNGTIRFMPNLFSILVIVVIFNYTIKVIKFFVDRIEKEELQIGGFHADWAQPTFRILKFLLYAFMLVLIFPYLPGSSSPAFQGVSVFLGVLISLGSSSAIANIVAGMVITYMRPFRIGDRVKIGDVTGDVLEKTMLVTRIRSVKNEDITVPNSTVLLHNTTNYSSNVKAPDSGLIVHTTISLGYDVPWKLVYATLIKAALRSEQILKTPPPFVLQTSLDDFYVSYQLNGYTREANNQARLYSELHQNIQDCCAEAGIEIMSPHYRAVRDGNAITIPGKDEPQ
jgi:small-conductance mechanosensitive channel